METVLWSAAVATFQRAYHDSQAWPLRLEIRWQSCQNIFLLLLWGCDGLKPKVQPFCSEALTASLMTWWGAVRWGYWRPHPKSRHCQEHINPASGALVSGLPHTHSSEAQILRTKVQILNVHLGPWRLLFREAGTDHFSTVRCSEMRGWTAHLKTKWNAFLVKQKGRGRPETEREALMFLPQ